MEYAEVNSVIRLAEPKDIDGLVAINAKWQRETLSTTKNGFLSGRFSEATFTNIITNEDIIVLDVENLICGYYLINNDPSDSQLQALRDKIHELKQKGLIPKNAATGVATQVLIDEAYQGKGFRKILLTQLIKTIGNRYHYLFSTISKENNKSQKANNKDGWELVAENEKVFFVMLDVKNYTE